MHLDIFVSRASIVTSRGLGFFELSLDTQPELKVDRFLPDRKVGKTLSSAACWGLASINALKDDLKLLPHLDPYRRGLFVAAPPPYTSDKCSYNESILESSKNLTDPLQVFGRIFDAASPTTALMGLPNGLTCFGARILDARGPHGTYVGREASVHTAVSAAVTHLRLGRIDNFIVAGFVNTSEEFFTESLFDFLNKKSGVPIPRTCTGGFASFLSSRIEDFNGVEPMAVLTSVSQ
ncbi:MAG: hypothetical protein NTV34_12575, partial [Proteobacteria bacterium]|nr:hypothetical protein [Pseudomonadota bacterium]